MNLKNFDMGDIDIAWCPGCGNFNILQSLKLALTESRIQAEEVVVVSGIGQAAKIPHYFRTHFFNGLHGRALPPATAIKAVNPTLTVIAESGDGDMYGEGGNHFLHAIRRNPDITNIVHNNMVYGLTKGQASPTSQQGFRTPVQVKGVFLEPINPLALAITLGAPFVARTFAGDIEQTKDILKQAIAFKGYALVDILQPCVSFNKINTFRWFRENTSWLDNSHDPKNRDKALELASRSGKLPLGVIYSHEGKRTFEENIGIYESDKTPLPLRKIHQEALLRKIILSKNQ
jgi:2-oxoglutarate ferredoxin oxidoreductase subunit beta